MLFTEIVGGAPASDPAVVAIVQRSQSCTPDTPPVECTGTLIAPHVVVTAAHCLGAQPANALEVIVAGVKIPIVGGLAHPAFDDTTHANDVAVLLLGSDAQVTPIPLRRDPLPDVTGEVVRIVGFGVTSPTASDVGIERAGEASVQQVSTDELKLAPAPAMSCQGDSGGPVILGGELVGITSWGDPACSGFGIAMRADRYVAFIDSVVLVAQRAFDPDEDLCATSCDDCPAETMCFEGHCSYHGLPAGRLGAECSDGSCVSVPGGACRQFIPCGGEPPVDDGCGCQSSSPPSVLLLLSALALLRRTGRAARR